MAFPERLLGLFMPIDDFAKESLFLSILANPRHEFYLPTQAVVDTPQFVTPRVARAYQTDLYHYNGSLKYIGEIPSDMRPVGPFHGSEVYLWEVYRNEGSCDQIDYQHVGFMFLAYLPPHNKKYPLFLEAEMRQVSHPQTIPELPSVILGQSFAQKQV